MLTLWQHHFFHGEGMFDHQNCSLDVSDSMDAKNTDETAMLCNTLMTIMGAEQIVR